MVYFDAELSFYFDPYILLMHFVDSILLMKVMITFFELHGCI